MTAHVVRPTVRPANPHFSSGPATKYPGWKLSDLESALIGRSHRSETGIERVRLAVEKTHEILQLPEGYKICIVPGSDTGAVEMAMWSLLGARGVDVLAWEVFGLNWVRDVVYQLKIDDVREFTADYGELPDLSKVDFSRDVIFTWNGTTSGVRVPNGDWIAADREGLTICDATSAIFANEMDWDKLDVITYSWQKVLGGEAAHGMLILSPRAIERLETYEPAWPVPKLFRLTKFGKLKEGFFSGGLTVNTPSLLCVEDYLNCLRWAESVGGVQGLVDRTDRNSAVVCEWVDRTAWIDYLGGTPETRSKSAICLKFTDPEIASRSDDGRRAFADRVVALLQEEGVGFDFGAYKDAPPGLRIWCGATVEKADLEAFLPWIDWAYAVARQEDVAIAS